MGLSHDWTGTFLSELHLFSPRQAFLCPYWWLHFIWAHSVGLYFPRLEERAPLILQTDYSPLSASLLTREICSVWRIAQTLMNQAFLNLLVILHFEWSENGGNARLASIKVWRNSSGAFVLLPMWMRHISLPCTCVWATNEAHLWHAAVALLLHASVKAPGSTGLLWQPPPPTHTSLCPSLTWITHDQTVCVELMSQLLREPQRHRWLHNAVPSLALCSPPDVRGAEWWIMGHHSPPSSAVEAIAHGLVQHGCSSNTCTAERRGSDVMWTRRQSAAEQCT